MTTRKTSVLQAALAQNRQDDPPTTTQPRAGQGALRTAPSREGKANVSAWLHPGFQTGLRMIHAITGKPKQELLAEALNDFFAKHNVPQVRDD